MKVADGSSPVASDAKSKMDDDYHQLMKKLKKIAFENTMKKIDNRDYTDGSYIFKTAEKDEQI
ncbi:MAG: hypothetical protein ACOCRV_01605 [bacterium]